jgi:hypothetical protein
MAHANRLRENGAANYTRIVGEGGGAIASVWNFRARGGQPAMPLVGARFRETVSVSVTLVAPL